jgi:hypothetical protein
MGYLPSFRDQIKATELAIPDAAQIPAAHTHFYNLAKALEKRMVLRLPSIAVAQTEPTSLNPIEPGMFVVTTVAPYEVYFRVPGAWKKIWPTTYNGTTVPAASLGVDDDLYIMY